MEKAQCKWQEVWGQNPAKDLVIFAHSVKCFAFFVQLQWIKKNDVEYFLCGPRDWFQHEQIGNNLFKNQ